MHLALPGLKPSIDHEIDVALCIWAGKDEWSFRQGQAEHG